MKKRISIICLLAILMLGAQAKVRLPNIIGDNMVVQQNSEARLWGWAKPGATVKISTSWANETYSAKADSKGKWLVKVKTPKASFTPLQITFDDGDGSTLLNNVLSGEVWVCAGQSNMEMPLSGFKNCPVEGYNDVVANANNYSGIHFVKIPSTMSMTPQDDAQCAWESVSPSTVGNCSATGYFFAQTVSRVLNIPVGLMLANKGGSRVESWLTRETLEKYTDEPTDTTGIVAQFGADYLRTMVWGNGTFNPILNYTIKGILYYQGESNVGNPANQYSERMKLLAEQWRTQFALGEIPFYFVEVVPFNYDTLDGTRGALLREQQARAVNIIPHSGMVCTNDLAYPYEYSQVHPTQKRQVGERLAYLALNKDYDVKSILCESPQYESMKISGDTCYIQLKNTYNGLNRLNDLQGFEVAGADKVFHPAIATCSDAKGLVITCPDVKQPVAVRYCFRNFQLGNVKNMANLPLIPFRTDTW